MKSNLLCCKSLYLYKNLKFIFLILSVLSLFFLSSCSLSLAGDVTPPPVFEPSLAADTSQPAAAATALPEPTQTAVEVQQATTVPDEPLTQSAAEIEGEIFQINGYLEGLTDPSQIKGLQAELMGYEGMQLYSTTLVDVNEDGSFSFSDVEWRGGLIYFVSVDYEGMLFTSDMLLTEDIPAGAVVDLAVEIYATTTDLSGLLIDRAHVFINFLDTQTIQVVLYAIVSNTSGQLLTPFEDGSPALNFILPEGAQNLQFESGSLGDRYVQTESGFGDLTMIQPGSQVYEILYAYSLPFDRKITVPIEFPLPVISMILAVPTDGLQLKTESLTDAGQRMIDDQTVQLYSGSDLAANTPLELSFSGGPGQTSAGGIGISTELLFGLLVFVFVLAVTAYWFLRIRKKKSPQLEAEMEEEEKGQSQEDLLDAILKLDDQYEAGRVLDEDYHLKRRELKMQLKKLKESLDEE